MSKSRWAGGAVDAAERRTVAPRRLKRQPWDRRLWGRQLSSSGCLPEKLISRSNRGGWGCGWEPFALRTGCSKWEGRAVSARMGDEDLESEGCFVVAAPEGPGGIAL
jgi:hypothetical protein